MTKSEADLDREVTVRTAVSRFRTEVTVREHAVVVDEPEALGGQDEGPTPLDLLCAALGSCTTITLRMYADRKQWPLEEVIARVMYGRQGREGGGKEEELENVFAVELEIRGPVDDGQRARLLEIASRCPVHRTLSGGARVETRLR